MIFTARRYTSAVYAVVLCLRVCPKQAGIVSKRLNGDPLAGSPCNHWYKNILFGIFVATFEVSSCTKFQIFRGSVPDHAGELTTFPRPSSWWGGELAPPPQEPHPAYLTAIRYCYNCINVSKKDGTDRQTDRQTVVPGASPRGGLGWTCSPHFCQRSFLRLMQIR